jgi:hypothetical protein
VLAADERPPVEEMHTERLERHCERGLGLLSRLLLHRVVCIRRRHLTRVLAEAEPRIRRPSEQRIDRADEVEHRAVDHRPLARIARIELVEAVLVAEVLHDRAALPE